MKWHLESPENTNPPLPWRTQTGRARGWWGGYKQVCVNRFIWKLFIHQRFLVFEPPEESFSFFSSFLLFVVFPCSSFFCSRSLKAAMTAQTDRCSSHASPALLGTSFRPSSVPAGSGLLFTLAHLWHLLAARCHRVPFVFRPHSSRLSLFVRQRRHKAPSSSSSSSSAFTLSVGLQPCLREHDAFKFRLIPLKCYIMFVVEPLNTCGVFFSFKGVLICSD